MKLAILLSLAAAASAFPKVNMKKESRDVLVPRAGCTSSANAACQSAAVIPISNAEIDYVPGSPTPAQVLSGLRTNCGALTGPCVVFQPKQQLVSQTGKYAYASPVPGQIRGPCPGLNAASNHGYLPRNGVAHIADTILGLGQMYGMSADLAGFLAAYAIAFDGDILTMSWSIGGPPPYTGPDILNPPQGISFSHNKYEGDTSIGRCDAYVNNGDAHSLSINRFKTTFGESIKGGRFNLDRFARSFTKNTERSVRSNAYYAAPLFSTTLVSPAAYNFVINLMSNHSASEKSGYLDAKNFQTFFGVKGTYPNFQWLPGQERLPPNWYRRPLSTPYTASTGVFGDLAAEFAAYPKSFRFGGNTDGTNSYTGIDIADFSNNAYQLEDLTTAKGLGCFFYQFEQQFLPDQLRGGFNDVVGATNLILKYLTPIFGKLNCPTLTQFKDNPIGGFPGYNYDPQGPSGTC